jgi:hypothetical protein
VRVGGKTASIINLYSALSALRSVCFIYAETIPTALSIGGRKGPKQVWAQWQKQRPFLRWELKCSQVINNNVYCVVLREIKGNNNDRTKEGKEEEE